MVALRRLLLMANQGSLAETWSAGHLTPFRVPLTSGILNVIPYWNLSTGHGLRHGGSVFYRALGTRVVGSHLDIIGIDARSISSGVSVQDRVEDSATHLRHRSPQTRLKYLRDVRWGGRAGIFGSASPGPGLAGERCTLYALDRGLRAVCRCRA